MLRSRLFLRILNFTVIIALFSFNSFANDEVKIQIISKDRNELRARISTEQLKQDSPYFKTFQKVEVIGEVKNPDSKVIDMEWKKIKLDGREVDLPKSFKSKIKVKSDIRDIKVGSEFTAHGSSDSIITSVEKILNDNNDEEVKKASKKNSSSSSTSNSPSFDNSAFISAQAENVDLLDNIDESTAQEGEITSATDGCSLRFDYTENKVFIQTRKIQDGIEVESCKDSSISFDILKDYEACSGANMLQLYYLDDNQVKNNIGSCIGDSVIVDSTEGCTARVDYILNKVFIQTRKIQDGIEVESCKDSSTSFTLVKDYEACPDQENLVSLKFIVNFQYFYNDQDSARNNVGDCREDETQRSDIIINQDYASCDQHIDLSNLEIYDQYKETYDNQAGTTIVRSDCQIDYTRSYDLVEDFTACQLNNNFDQSFSTRKRNIGYTDSQAQYQEIYSCLDDVSITYPHQQTQNTCDPVIANGLTQLFQRKYVEIAGNIIYISECEAFGNQISVQEESCTSTPYTHEVDNSKSYGNINTYYMSGGSKIYLSNCVKSSTSFTHQLDTSVCSSVNDDTTKKTSIFGRIFFMDNGSKIYVTSSCAETSEVSYTQIGHIWQNIFSNQTKSIQVANSGDQTLLGKKHGDEAPALERVNYGVSCGTDETQRINLYDIGTYSNTGKCQSYNNPTYNGVSIDTSSSDLPTITFSNYVQNVSIAVGTYKWRQSCPSGTLTTRSLSGDNFAYYQRCTDYSCPLTQVKRYPIYRRGDDSQYTDSSSVLEEKYLCGNPNLLNNQQTIY